ncbi:MAG: radical SAM protein [Candidatus Edwardsbacteria bacterium]
MKIQFIFAPPQVSPKFGELGKKISPPLGILYLAAYLRSRRPDLEISVFDGVRYGYHATWKAIKQFGPDILGISYYTPTALSALILADRVKAESPETLVLLGGPHATALPEEGIERSRADVVVIGEGEETVRELVEAYEKSRGRIGEIPFEQIDGIAFRRNEMVQKTEVRKFIVDIDSIPFPARDLVKMEDYRGFYISKNWPQTNMIMSRGCPLECTFCSNLVWRLSTPRVRLRSPQNIAEEIEHLIKDFGMKEVFDNADEFNANPYRAKAICEEIKKRRLKITWKTQLRASPLPEELVKSMAKSGCWYVHLGIESGNPETLKGIRKNITLDQVIKACRLLKKYDIKIHGLFMLFNVWEEEGQLRFEDVPMTRNTLNFAQRLADQRLLDYFGWSITTPYPGSPLYETASKFGLIQPRLINHWDAWLSETSFVMKLPGVSEIEQAHLKTIGSKLRTRCMFRSKGIELRDFGYFLRKLLKLGQNEIKGRIAKWRKG